MHDTIRKLQEEFDRAELHADTERLHQLIADDSCPSGRRASSSTRMSGSAAMSTAPRWCLGSCARRRPRPISARAWAGDPPAPGGAWRRVAGPNLARMASPARSEAVFLGAVSAALWSSSLLP